MLIILISLLCIIAELWIISDLELSEKDKNKLYFGVIFLEFFIILGFRDISVLGDTDSYAYHFNKILNKVTPFYIVKANDRFSIGYLIFEQFIYQEVSSSFLFYNIVTTFLILGSSLLFFYKYSASLPLTLYLFIVSKLVFSEAIALRQGLALSFLLLGYGFLFKDKNIKYIVCVLLASTFHSSAWILFLIPLLCIKSISFKIKRNILLAIACFVFIVFETLLHGYIDVGERYQNASEKAGFFSLVGVFNMLVALMAYGYTMYMERLAKKNEMNLNFEELRLITLLYFIVSTMSIRLFVFERFAIYFLPLVFVYISYLYYDLKYIKSARVATFLFLFAQTVSSLFVMCYRPEWTKILPYSFYQS